MLNFSYTILYVADVTATIAFYEKAFGLNRKFIVPDGTYGELLTGSTTLSFAEHGLASSNLNTPYVAADIKHHPPGMEIGFTTTDVAGAYQKAISAGAIAEKAPATKPWGQVVAYVRDLNGFLVELCSPMS